MEVLDASCEEIKDNDDLKAKRKEGLYKLTFDSVEQRFALYDHESGQNIRFISLKAILILIYDDMEGYRICVGGW